MARQMLLAVRPFRVANLTQSTTRMSENVQPTAKKTLGLTGLTVNAMALIAPGAFLWLTFGRTMSLRPADGRELQCGSASLLRCCSVLQRPSLMPNCRNSIQVPVRRTSSPNRLSCRNRKPFRFARIAKFVVGWASHLYYWIYPGVMVAVTAILVGYLAGQLFPSIFNAAVPSPLLMILFCIVFPFVRWIHCV